MMTILDFRDGPQAVPDPPHAHPHEQVTYVAAGEILFILEGQAVHLQAGDVFTVPSNQAHSIQLLSDYVRLVDCFTPLREDFFN
jgi:quercetin dioxygenase-like cupin family protein